MESDKPFPLLLIVDDDVVLRYALQEVFEFSQYVVVTAGSGTQGLELLRTMYVLPDLIISDMVMPEMDGFQFMQCVQAEAIWQHIPFIFLSGKPRNFTDVPPLQQVHYIPKPFMIEELLAEVGRILR